MSSLTLHRFAQLCRPASSAVHRRAFAISSPLLTETPTTSPDTPRTVTLIPGDGIGPEIANSVQKIFEAAGVPLKWESVDVTPVRSVGYAAHTSLSSRLARSRLMENSAYPFEQLNPSRRIASDSKAHWQHVRNPLLSHRRPKNSLSTRTAVGKGHQSLNLALRKQFNLFANVRPCKSLQGCSLLLSFSLTIPSSGFETPYTNVDLVTIRENTEGEYSGIEHTIVPGVVQSIKLITEHASLRVCEYAFLYAKQHKREKVTVVHKANIMYVGSASLDFSTIEYT